MALKNIKLPGTLARPLAVRASPNALALLDGAFGAMVGGDMKRSGSSAVNLDDLLSQWEGPAGARGDMADFQLGTGSGSLDRNMFGDPLLAAFSTSLPSTSNGLPGGSQAGKPVIDNDLLSTRIRAGLSGGPGRPAGMYPGGAPGGFSSPFPSTSAPFLGAQLPYGNAQFLGSSGMPTASSGAEAAAYGPYITGGFSNAAPFRPQPGPASAGAFGGQFPSLPGQAPGQQQQHQQQVPGQMAGAFAGADMASFAGLGAMAGAPPPGFNVSAMAGLLGNPGMAGAMPAAMPGQVGMGWPAAMPDVAAMVALAGMPPSAAAQMQGMMAGMGARAGGPVPAGVAMTAGPSVGAAANLHGSIGAAGMVPTTSAAPTSLGGVAMGGGGQGPQPGTLPATGTPTGGNFQANAGAGFQAGAFGASVPGGNGLSVAFPPIDANNAALAAHPMFGGINSFLSQQTQVRWTSGRCWDPSTQQPTVFSYVSCSLRARR